jgi:uncharacterized protein DUF6589
LWQGIIISWDNFDYNQRVRHQILQERDKHFSATTGVLCIGHSIPAGGLLKIMYHPDVPLKPGHVYHAAGNPDGISKECQQFRIAEAIRYTHRQAVESVFNQSHQASQLYPIFPSVERLEPRKTPNFNLGPLLEDEGTIEGTFEVIDRIFQDQLGLDDTCTFDHRLQLVYGDKKSISLIQSVKKQRKYSMNTYGRFDWLLPIPGLFHWKINYMDMIYDINSGSDPSHALIHTTLLHNERYMGCDRCRRARVPRRQGLCTI